MIVDGRQVDNGAVIEGDVVIAGAGAAGITLARKLAARGHRVVLVESGGLDFDPAVQDLYRGTLSGLEYFSFNSGRLRYFGGTTNHWNGWCVPPVAEDFLGLDFAPELAWPIGESNIKAHLAEAFDILDLGAFPAAVQTAPALATQLPDAGVFRSTQIHESPPTRFGEKYRAEIERHGSLRLLLHSNVTSITRTDRRPAISQLDIRTLTGKSFAVRGRFFVLACHGLENARLLLDNELHLRPMMGPAFGHVGRYFADHPSYQVGRLLLYRGHLRPDTFARRSWLRGAANGQVALVPSRDALNEARALPFRIHFGGTGGLDAGTVGTLTAIGALLQNTHPDVHKNLARSFLVTYVQAVQQPNRDSRLTLVAERNALGQRKAHLHYALTERDKETARAIPLMLGGYFGRAGMGRFWIEPSMRSGERVLFANHHMCTTRMSADPRTGVVDGDCRVFSVDNLYMAGSSVFANGGNFTPTMMIVLLALRLAAHLDGKLRG